MGPPALLARASSGLGHAGVCDCPPHCSQPNRSSPAELAARRAPAPCTVQCVWRCAAEAWATAEVLSSRGSSRGGWRRARRLQKAHSTGQSDQLLLLAAGPRYARAPSARHVHRYSLSVARVAAASTDQSGDLPLAARIAPPHRSRERWITAMLRRSYCTVCSSGRRAAAAAARAACAALVVTTPSTLRACVCESRSSRTLSGCRRQRRRLAGRKAPPVYGCPKQQWVPWRCCSSLRLWCTAT